MKVLALVLFIVSFGLNIYLYNKLKSLRNYLEWLYKWKNINILDEQLYEDIFE